MLDRLQKLINLIKNTGEKVIFPESAYFNDFYVILNIKDYERLVGSNNFEPNLTLEGLTDKIDDNVANWPASPKLGGPASPMFQQGGQNSFEKPEQSDLNFASWQNGSDESIKDSQENLDDDIRLEEPINDEPTAPEFDWAEPTEADAETDEVGNQIDQEKGMRDFSSIEEILFEDSKANHWTIPPLRKVKATDQTDNAEYEEITF